MKVERGDGGGSWRGREGGRNGREEEDRELKVGEDSDGEEEEEGRAGGS